MSAPLRAFAAPDLGEVVLTRFPSVENPGVPGSKPRPCIVLGIRDPVTRDGPVQVDVCFGTSQKVDRLYRGEFAVTRQEHRAEYVAMGLSVDTKFDLNRVATLDFDSMWFMVPNRPRYGQSPKLGIMLPETVVRLRVAASRKKR